MFNGIVILRSPKDIDIRSLINYGKAWFIWPGYAKYYTGSCCVRVYSIKTVVFFISLFGINSFKHVFNVGRHRTIGKYSPMEHKTYHESWQLFPWCNHKSRQFCLAKYLFCFKSNNLVFSPCVLLCHYCSAVYFNTVLCIAINSTFSTSVCIIIGVIILVEIDERFRDERNRAFISKWLRRPLRVYDIVELVGNLAM